MCKKIVVGSRDSKLAVAQTVLVLDQIKKANPGLSIELVTLKTTGDKILDKTLDKIGGKGLFVKELDQALMDGRIDLAIHSLKDMPMETPKELPILAYPKRGEMRDVLVLPKNSRPGSYYLKKVGTSSARRQLQLSKLYPIAYMESIRGNIVTRLKKLDEGEYSALVLAGAGLVRIGLEHRIYKYFEPEEMLPAAGQGILAIQGRKDFDTSILEKINHKETQYAAMAERSFVRALNGGCSSPIAAYAKISGGTLTLTGLHYNETTSQHAIDSIKGAMEDGEALGRTLANQLKGEIGI